jgi:hypothetical protein
MDSLIHEAAPRSRLQIASASRMAQGLALADARQKASELFLAMDDTLRALKALQACGAHKDFLWDCAAGLKDQARNVAHAIDVELEERSGCDPLESIDLSELDAFLESVR